MVRFGVAGRVPDELTELTSQAERAKLRKQVRIASQHPLMQEDNLTQPGIRTGHHQPLSVHRVTVQTPSWQAPSAVMF